jgi:transcription elongation factor Elf1
VATGGRIGDGSLSEYEDPMEEMYWKYIKPRETDFDKSVTCPKCGSSDVDHRRGYRGEYTCKSCGHLWKSR